MKSGVFHLGDISFDPATRAVTGKDGGVVRLRNKSKEVLAFLLETPNQTVRKGDILESVWADVTVSDESLVQCVADIRRVIGSDARQIVETVPREGYRVNVAEAPARARPPFAVLAAGLALLGGLVVWAVWPSSPKAVEEPVQVASDKAPRTGPPGTSSAEAYMEVLQGRVSAERFSLDESLVAERHFRRAIELDPEYARAYAELGTLLSVRFENDWTVLEEADKRKALFYAEQAAALDPDLWLAHYALGRLHSIFENFEAAEAHLEKAMSLDPGNEDARAYLAVVKNFQGEPEQARAILEPVIASHPNPPFWYHFALGHALFNLERYEDAGRALSRCLDVGSQSPYCLRYLIAVQGTLGQLAEAEGTAAIYEALGFPLSVAEILALVPFHHVDDRARLAEGLRLAGVPE